MPSVLLPLAYKISGHAAALAGSVSIVAVTFRDEITLGSIVATSFIIAVAALFTIRGKIANVWREQAEGEKALKERAQEELAAALADRAKYERSQQEIRHELVDKVTTLELQLQAVEAKTDLSAALESIRAMNASLATEFTNQITVAMSEQGLRGEKRDGTMQRLLEEIRDRLPGPVDLAT